VGRGDNVALFLRRSIPLVVGQLATLKLGAAYVPQHVGVAPESQLRYVLDTTAATVILTLSDLADQIPVGEGETIIELDRFLADQASLADGQFLDHDLDRVPVEPDDRCFILFSSGTTGNPNGVQVTHRNVGNVLLTAPGNLGNTVYVLDKIGGHAVSVRWARCGAVATV